MRVLLVNQFYRPDPAPTGQLLADLAEQLAQRGHEVHVLCSCRCYAGGAVPVADAADGSRIHVHRVGATGFGRRCALHRVCDYASFLALATLRALRLPRMDVCVALTTPPLVGGLGVLLQVLRGTRLVHWTMDLYPEMLVACGRLRPGSWLHGTLAGLSRKLNDAAARVISLGDDMTARLVAAGTDRGKIIAVDNWVPGEVVRPLRRETSSLRARYGLDGTPTLMYSGNLGVGHDLETVFRALARLPMGVRPRVIIAGEGARRRELLRLAADLRLERVTFQPLRPLGQLADSLAAGDVHLVTQRAGTVGLLVPSKIYGLLAAGRAVLFIGPAESAVADILRRSGAGLVVSPGDVARTRAALMRLLADGALREAMGRRGRRYYEAHFGCDRSTARIAAVIESVGGEAHDLREVRGRLEGAAPRRGAFRRHTPAAPGVPRGRPTDRAASPGGQIDVRSGADRHSVVQASSVD